MLSTGSEALFPFCLPKAVCSIEDIEGLSNLSNAVLPGARYSGEKSNHVEIPHSNAPL